MDKTIVEAWADILAVRLGRPVSELTQRGLSASDFPSNEEVRIQFDSGDSMHFKCAFFVIDDEREMLGLFSEHSGYFEFPSKFLRATSIKTEVYTGEEFE